MKLRWIQSLVLAAAVALMVFSASGITADEYAAAELSGEKAQQIDSLMSYCHENGLFNGVILVKEGGRTLYEKAWGRPDLRRDDSLQPDSSFYLASVSKQFTAAAVMTLVEDGALSYDSKLSQLLPVFPKYAGDVTVHQLLTHTAGVPDYFRLLGQIPDDLTNQQVLAELAKVPDLDFPPGSRFSYSNSGYVLLSLIVAEVSGRPYHRFMEERFFQPLGMKRTLVYDASKPKIERRAKGFTAAGEPSDYRLLTTGGGGMFSTVGDLSIWDDALYGDRLFKPETLKRAYSKVPLSNGEMSSYGYGWNVQEIAGRKIVLHHGGLPGFRSFFWRDLNRRNSMIMLSNMGASMDFDQLIDAISAIFDGEPPKKPLISVARHLSNLIDRQGLASALVSYDRIREEKADRFDLGEQQLNSLGYHYIAEGDLDTAIVLLKKNVSLFPESFNVYDSLGEAFMLRSMKRPAIVNYARSLVLNPENENAIQMLERLRTSESGSE